MFKLSQFPNPVLILVLLILTVFTSINLYSQTLESPPYGLSVEKWKQIQEPPKYNLNGNLDINGGGLLTNGGFEAGDFSGWVIQDLTSPFFPLLVDTAGITPGFSFFMSSPTEGSFAALHGWDGDGPDTIRIAQDVTLPVGVVSLEFDYRAAWDLASFGATLDRTFEVNVEPSGGGTPLQTNLIITAKAGTNNPDTGELLGSIDVSAFANSAVRISFDWTVPENFSGPGFFQLDNVFLIPVDLGPQIIVSPSNIDFGKFEVGKSTSPRTITIRSVGSENLTVSGISDPGSPFSLSNVPALPVVIPPGGSETFEVTFSPTSKGVFNSSITVSSDDPDDPTKDVSLNGEGVVINPAMQGVCYASTGNNDGGRLLTIDINTGAGTLIGPTGLISVPGLAINSNGNIFGIDGATFDLYKIDAATGTAIFVASTGLVFLPAIAFDGNDVLYGLGFDPNTFEWNLYTINTTTGLPTIVGPAPMGDWRGMAFDPTDGTLWASTNGEDIYVINPNTGEPTLIGTTGVGGGTPDIHFDDMGNLYGALGGGGAANNNLISIDKSTGAGTVIGPIGFTSVSGMASRQQPLVGPHIGVIPPSINFGNAEVGGSSSPHTVTIRSVGSQDLTVSGISDPGSPFSLSNVPTLPVVIPPGGSETFEVTFSPASAAMFNSTITVTSDDPDDPTKDVSLTGEAIIINPAMPGVCYASTGNNDGGRLLTIDINTGAGTLIGPTGLNNVPGLAINSNGDMYGTDGNADLYKIDAATGTAIFVASTGLLFLPAIAFDGNDVLYGLGYDAVTFNNTLYTINTTTGVPTVVGPAPMGDWRGMAFDPTDGTIWASTSFEEIYVIDPNTGTPTLIGTTGLGVGTPDIHFDNEGNLYGAAGGGVQIDDLVSINKTTGAATNVGSIGFTSVSGLSLTGIPVSVEDEAAGVPTVYSLLQNYPNPFNPTTAIKYAIPKESFVKIIVYNIIGEEIVDLVNEVKKVGNYTVQFDGSRLSSGIYFYRIQAADFTETKKMVVLK